MIVCGTSLLQTQLQIVKQLKEALNSILDGKHIWFYLSFMYRYMVAKCVQSIKIYIMLDHLNVVNLLDVEL